MDIDKTYKYYTCILIRKILSKEIHTNITFKLKHEHNQQRQLRNANNIILHPPRTNYGKKNITFESAQIYNKIPNDIKESKTLFRFKKLLKTHLEKNRTKP